MVTSSFQWPRPKFLKSSLFLFFLSHAPSDHSAIPGLSTIKTNPIFWCLLNNFSTIIQVKVFIISHLTIALASEIFSLGLFLLPYSLYTQRDPLKDSWIKSLLYRDPSNSSLRVKAHIYNGLKSPTGCNCHYLSDLVSYIISSCSLYSAHVCPLCSCWNLPCIFQIQGLFSWLAPFSSSSPCSNVTPDKSFFWPSYIK